VAEKDGRQESEDRQNQNHMWRLVHQIWSAAQDVRCEGTSLFLIHTFPLKQKRHLANVRSGSTTAENTVTNSRLLYPQQQTLMV
jgi:hypothetical protein